jgi:hypothetical protein
MITWWAMMFLGNDLDKPQALIHSPYVRELQSELEAAGRQVHAPMDDG